MLDSPEIYLSLPKCIFSFLFVKNPQVFLYKSKYVAAGQEVIDFASTKTCAQDTFCIQPEPGKAPLPASCVFCMCDYACLRYFAIHCRQPARNYTWQL